MTEYAPRYKHPTPGPQRLHRGHSAKTPTQKKQQSTATMSKHVPSGLGHLAWVVG